MTDSIAAEATVNDLHRLINSLREEGFTVIGPTVGNGAVQLAAIDSADQLPTGYREQQEGGRYRLVQSGDRRRFGFSVSCQSWKRFLYPPDKTVLSAYRKGRSFKTAFCQDDHEPLALLGVRPCELTAIRILDRVFFEGPYVDSSYASRRKNCLIVAVNCTRPGDTCFCDSMGTGPAAGEGCDLEMTELPDGSNDPVYVLQARSERGSSIIGKLNLSSASSDLQNAAHAAVKEAAGRMGRHLETENLPKILIDAVDDRHWDEIAARCLTCGNCTMVCPTCFCANIEDATDISGNEAVRTRLWDSCFSVNFSYIHGGSVRAGEMSRYRQWMTHKLGYWQEQFDTLGCVGCGRCITWCPVGIDITEEAKVFREKV